MYRLSHIYVYDCKINFVMVPVMLVKVVNKLTFGNSFLGCFSRCWLSSPAWCLHCHPLRRVIFYGRPDVTFVSVTFLSSFGAISLQSGRQPLKSPTYLAERFCAPVCRRHHVVLRAQGSSKLSNNVYGAAD